MLVEIIMGKKTGDEALAAALDYVRAIRKTPIVVNDSRGFYANRCVGAYMREGHLMLIEGVPPAMIENVAQDGRHAGRARCRSTTRWRSTSPEDPAGDQGAGRRQTRSIPTQEQLLDEHGGEARPPRPQERQGLLRLSGERQEAPLAGPRRDLQKTKLDPDALDVEELKQRFLVIAGARSGAQLRGEAWSPIRARPMSARSSASASRPTPAARSPTSTAWAPRPSWRSPRSLQKKYGERFKPTRLLAKMAKEGTSFYDQPKAEQAKQAA